MCHCAIKVLNDCITVVVHTTGSAVVTSRASSDEKHPVEQKKIEFFLTTVSSKSKLPTSAINGCTDVVFHMI